MSETRVEGVEIFYETESGYDQFLMMGSYNGNNPTTFYVYPSFVGFEGTQALNGDISTLQVISSNCAKDKIITSLVSSQEVKINDFELSQNTTIFKNETIITGNKTLPQATTTLHPDCFDVSAPLTSDRFNTISQPLNSLQVKDLDFLVNLDREIDFKFKELVYCTDKRSGGLINFQTRLVDA